MQSVNCLGRSCTSASEIDPCRTAEGLTVDFTAQASIVLKVCACVHVQVCAFMHDCVSVYAKTQACVCERALARGKQAAIEPVWSYINSCLKPTHSCFYTVHA